MKRKILAEVSSDVVERNGNELTKVDKDDGPSQKISKSEALEIRSKEERERFKSNLYRPPTSEELNELKETETLYKSNLFRLQISYLLEEVKGVNIKSKSLEKFMHSLHEFFGKLEPTEKYDLSDISWLPNDVRLPIPDLSSKHTKGKFCFSKPTNIKVVGSYLLKTVTKPNYNVDIAVEMPEECFQVKDYLNFRYHAKRAIYLVMLASQLKNWGDVESLKFGQVENNPFKPILILKPAGKAGNRFVVKIHPIVPEKLFKLSRFGPTRSNVRPDWFNGTNAQDNEQDIGNPTPKYNASVLGDMLMEQHLNLLFDAIDECPGMVDAIALLKVWLHQRGFTQGDSCFNGFQMSMLTVYLLRTKKISAHMSSYQIFRITLHHISKSDWTVKGITMASCDDKINSTLPSVENFHEVYDVVFVDSSGYLNLCANMRKTTFEQLKYEAALAIEILEDSKTNDFDALFMKSCRFYEFYDQWFSINDLDSLESLGKRKSLQAKVMDHGGDWLPVVVDWIMPTIRKGLGNKIDALEVKRQKPAEWSLDACPPNSCMSDVVIGLVINTENAENILIMGPSANDPEALEFRRFWGEKSDLRRFKDGSINEAVVWQASNKGEKRTICKQIVEFLFQRFCKLQSSSISYNVDQIDSLVKPKFATDLSLTEKKEHEMKILQNSTGEEDLLTAVYAFEELSRQIRNLDELPLEVNAIQGVHPVFRMTEVFPPRPSSHSQESKKGFMFPSIEKHSSWCPAIEAILQFEGSGKWPDDLEAIQYMKAAFYLKLASLLKTNCALVAMASTDHLDVLKKGFVFRLRIHHHRELFLYQQSKATGSMKKQHDSMAHRIDIDMVKRPLHTTMIYSLHQRFPVYSLTTRLAKRWISSQMLGDYVCDEVVELMVASLFISPAPYRAPSSHTSGFLRFLTMLQTYDWQTNPLIVDLNDSMKVEDYTSIQEAFSTNRHQLPAVFIATPYDKDRSIWSREKLTHQILRRLTTLADVSRNTLANDLSNWQESTIKPIFRPPLGDYDILIHLDMQQLPRHYQAVDSTVLLKRPKQRTTHHTSMPVVEFDPVQKYLEELRAAFSDVALFFYDKLGSLVIGVVWDKSSLNPQPFKILGAKYKMPSVASQSSKKVGSSDDSCMVPNTDAIISDFQILGKGLVADVRVINK